MYLLYDGPSRLDRAPIIVLATGIDTPSKNQKTGPMVQTYILRKDISPSEAVRSGADYSICGNCIHRGGHDRKRSCYVEVHKGPTSVWRSFAKKNPSPIRLQDPSTGRQAPGTDRCLWRSGCSSTFCLGKLTYEGSGPHRLYPSLENLRTRTEQVVHGFC